ncbi:hypothetical protein PUN28_013763 [Cardiocondyla obscurior]|uniref:Uncharacterized protein n=1 Tax=Cardiocondyla obscurior TaxID=286306 RepID=A0AAW2F333_9HYME
MIKEVTLPGFRQACWSMDRTGKGKWRIKERKKKKMRGGKGKKEERSARSAIIITGDGDTGRNTELPAQHTGAARQGPPRGRGPGSSRDCRTPFAKFRRRACPRALSRTKRQ